MTEGQDPPEMRQLWQDSLDSKVGAGHPGHDIGYDAGQDSPDRSAWTGRVTGQPGRVRQDRTERTRCQGMTARNGLWGQLSLGQKRWSMTSGTGRAGQGRRTGQAVQDR
jgi:hypothetical protein